MKRKHKRLVFVFVGLALLGIAATLILNAFNEHIVFFMSPTDLLQKSSLPDRRIRIGGLVERGSVEKAGGGMVRFRVTDLANGIPVTYKGILPDLFREGQGVVAQGRLVGNVFEADEVLAKHDENYMPPEVADAIKRAGQWREAKPKAP